MQFVITKEYDDVGDTIYRLYKYNFWFKLGARNSIHSKWAWNTPEIDIIANLKQTAENYARTQNKEAEIIEIFGVDE